MGSFRFQFLHRLYPAKMCCHVEIAMGVDRQKNSGNTKGHQIILGFHFGAKVESQPHPSNIFYDHGTKIYKSPDRKIVVADVSSSQEDEECSHGLQEFPAIRFAEFFVGFPKSIPNHYHSTLLGAFILQSSHCDIPKNLLLQRSGHK